MAKLAGIQVGIVALIIGAYRLTLSKISGSLCLLGASVLVGIYIILPKEFKILSPISAIDVMHKYLK